MQKFYYVYMLKSERDPKRNHLGRTVDLKERLMRHNRGEVSSASKHKPLEIQVVIAFDEISKAVEIQQLLSEPFTGLHHPP